jgi:hypothetical protein
MATYSVNNITIDNELHFSDNYTEGYFLTVAADGVTYWAPAAVTNLDGGFAASIFGTASEIDGGGA